MAYKPTKIDQNCYDAAINRIRRIYDLCDKVIVSFSGGKDSTCILNLALQVAHERHKLPLDVYFVDEEACYPETIEYVERVRARPDVRLKWVCLPIEHRNACSRSQPWWMVWDPKEKHRWCRPMPEGVITIENTPKFRIGMKLHDLGPLLYGPELGTIGDLTGIRTQESIRRLQTVLLKKEDNYISQPEKGYRYKCKPIYDWKTEDVWLATQKFGWDYNRTYDIQAMLGTAPSIQRVTPPFGEEPLMGLWKYKQGWPELWDKMLARVDGVNTAGLYALTDLYGTALKSPPAGMTWKSWANSLIKLYGDDQQKEIASNIAQAIKLHQKKTTRPIPDVESDPHSGLSWKFIALMVARGDFKGRKIQTLLQRGMMQAKKLGMTPQQIIEADLDDNSLV
jgi:predicted phosphoadenosine phosphosulfate sulfurtransferase